MAGRDELIYYVKFQPDERSLADMKRTISEMEGQADKVFSEEATQEAREWKEVIDEVNESNAEGLDRLIELQEQIDLHRGTLKEIRKAKREDVAISQEQREQEALAQASLKSVRKEYRDTQAAFIAQQAAAEGQAQTYNELVSRNRTLAAAMRDIPMDDTTGQLQQLKQEWKENNQALKEFDADIGDHRRNVGNYSEAISTLASGVAAIQGPLGPIAGRLNSINTTIRRAIPLLNAKAGAWVAVRRAMMGIMAVGILAFLGAILAAMRGLQPVMDQVTLRVNQLSAAWGNFTDLVGSWLGMNERTNVSLRETMRIVEELHQREIALEEARIQSLTSMAELEASIASLRREAEDEANSHIDRIEMMNEAMMLTQSLYDILREQLQEEIDIMRERHGLARNERHDYEELAKLEAELIDLNAAQDTQMRQLMRRRQSITRQMEVERQQRMRNIESLREEARTAMKASEDRMRQLRREVAESLDQALHQERIDIMREQNRDREAVLAEADRQRDMAVEAAEERRLEIVEKANELALTLQKQYLAEGVDAQEAASRAEVKAVEWANQRVVEIRSWRADEMARISEEERIRLDEIRRREEDAAQQARDNIEAMRQKSMARQQAADLAHGNQLEEQRLLLLNQRQIRENQLREQFFQTQMSNEEANRLAREQSELEFEERLAQAKIAIAENEMRQRREMMEAGSQAVSAIMTAAFGDQKEIRIAQALIDTFVGVNRALASADPPVSFMRAATVFAQGMANVRKIADTNIGDRPSGSGMRGSAGSGGMQETIFEVVPRDQIESPIAQQAAESSSDQRDFSPTFIFQGDMDPEVMAIKVKRGNRQIATSTPTIKSKA